MKTSNVKEQQKTFCEIKKNGIYYIYDWLNSSTKAFFVVNDLNKKHKIIEEKTRDHLKSQLKNHLMTSVPYPFSDESILAGMCV